MVVDKVNAAKKRISLKLFSSVRTTAEESGYREFLRKNAALSNSPFGGLSGLIKDKDGKQE